MKTARAGDWKIRPLPPRRATLLLDRRFTAREMERIRRGLIPEQMEDKWFVYWQDDWLFFHRSWTGFCVYAVRFVPEGDAWRMVEGQMNRDPAEYRETDDVVDAAMIHYLTDLLLLHRPSIFPYAHLPHERQALTNWSLVGRALLGEHPDNESGRASREVSTFGVVDKREDNLRVAGSSRHDDQPRSSRDGFGKARLTGGGQSAAPPNSRHMT